VVVSLDWAIFLIIVGLIILVAAWAIGWVIRIIAVIVILVGLYLLFTVGLAII
jgi:hypothetical protein